MGYAILRVQKLKSSQAVRRSLLHAYREQETPNADPERTPDNTASVGSARDALGRLNERLATQAKVRKNAVLAVEYLITASPEAMHGKTRDQQDAYFADARAWLEAKHGAENVVAWGIHRDETTPHMYAYVVPIDQRGKLNCRAFLGEKNAMAEMQTDFAKRVGQQHGLQRGIEGSKARHTTIQAYYARASEAFTELPKVTTPAPPKLRPEPEKPAFWATKADKVAYRDDHAEWERQRQAIDRQQRQRQAEIKAQRDAAVEVARRHEAQAKEAAATKREAVELKRSNGKLIKENRELLEVAEVVRLFTPTEIQRAQARKQAEQAAESARREKARAEAREAARGAAIDRERQRRIDALPALERTAHGAAATFVALATRAIKEAGSPDRVNWPEVDGRAAIEAISQNGQSPEAAADAILRLSPGRADPESHARVADWMAEKAPGLQAEYAASRLPGRSPTPPSPA
jgi:hypothetical protein